MLQATRSRALYVTRHATCVRSFFGSSSAVQVSPAELFPELPTTPTATIVSPPVLTSSTLPNGLRLISDTSYPALSTVGVRIHAGTQFETPKNAGVMHLWHCMAFRSTTTQSDLSLYRAIESLGGSVRSGHGRDFVDLALTTLPEHLDASISLVFESLTKPKFALWDVELMKRRALDEVETRGDVASIQSLLFEAAYYDTSALGRPVMDPESLADVTPSDLFDVSRDFVKPECLSIAGCGVSGHDALERLVSQNFGALVPAGSRVAPPTSKYVGGEVRVKVKSARKTVVGLAFEGLSSGSSNSSSKSAAEVLKTHLELKLNKKTTPKTQFHVTTESYASSGLFSIVFESSSHGACADILKSVLSSLKEPVSAADFQAAQAVCANRRADTDDRWTRFQTHVSNVPSISDLQKVTPEDVAKVAKEVFSTKPSLASIGQVDQVPRWNDIQA